MRRLDEVLGGDGLGPLPRPDVRVDEPVDVATYPQAEPHVAFW